MELLPILQLKSTNCCIKITLGRQIRSKIINKFSLFEPFSFPEYVCPTIKYVLNINILFDKVYISIFFYLFIYLFSQRLILRGVGSLRYNDTIQD